MNYRFHVVDPIGGNLDPVAGFTSVSTPDITVDVADYREGLFRWTQKFPGIQSVGEVQLSKGTVRRDTDFFNWLLKVINGAETYRTDIAIYEYHITDTFGLTGGASRILNCRECFPSMTKPMADKDATGSEVALQELTLTVEEISVELIPQR
jgi:phage tail-like protein